jgi:biopolymer transport protein ExbB
MEEYKMKRFFTKSIITLVLIGLLCSTVLFAQEEAIEAIEPEENPEIMAPIFDEPAQMSDFEILARKLVGSYLVQLFIDGGIISWPMLFLLIWGLAWVIWKAVALSYARINVGNFLNELLPLVKAKKFTEAIELAKKTRGPVASIAYAGLLKADKTTEALEKAIENTATVEMAFLEKGFISISLTINIAPMVGFLGTIIGMISAFDAIAKAGDVDPTIVAEGIKIALVTTLMGLSVAIPIQFINTILLQMVDGIVIDMQRLSDKLVESIVENK